MHILRRTDPRTGMSEREQQRRGILGIGAASLLSDTSHESVTSLLPQFLTSTMHTGPGVLGLIDGVADALAGVSKLVGGPLAADRERRGRLASSGYASTAVATALIGLTTAVWQVGVLRGVAWVSRGLRTPARDMLLTDLAEKGKYGSAFGVERAGDNAGAVLGPLCASALVVLVGVRASMVLAIVPGAFACMAIAYSARRARAVLTDTAGRRQVVLRLRDLRGSGLSRALVPIGAFEMGNLAATLLILRATDILRSDDARSATSAAGLAVLLYAGHNVIASAVALLSGRVIDLSTPRIVLVVGAGCYAVSYAAFGAGQQSPGVLVACFLLAGAGIGCAETAAGAMVAGGLPANLRAQGLGMLGLVQATGDLGATVVAGLLWSVFGPAEAFGYAAAWMVLTIMLVAVRRSTP